MQSFTYIAQQSFELARRNSHNIPLSHSIMRRILNRALRLDCPRWTEATLKGSPTLVTGYDPLSTKANCSDPFPSCQCEHWQKPCTGAVLSRNVDCRGRVAFLCARLLGQPKALMRQRRLHFKNITITVASCSQFAKPNDPLSEVQLYS